MSKTTAPIPQMRFVAPQLPQGMSDEEAQAELWRTAKADKQGGGQQNGDGHGGGRRRRRR